MKKYKGSLISLKLKNRRTPIEGIVLGYDKDWTLIRYNPVDYVIDGYALVNNRKVRDFQRTKEELFKEKVIKLKINSSANIGTCPALDLKGLIVMLVAHNDLVQIETNSEATTYVGYATLTDEGELSLSAIHPNGKKGKRIIIPIDKVRTIQYHNDYLTSLKLYIEHLKKVKN